MKIRKHISLKTKLAAALRCMMVEEDGKLVPALSYDDAKFMSTEDVLSLFHFDHGIHHGIDGSDEHWNLTPRFIAEHRRKTAKIDKPMLAKAARIADKHADFQRKILAKSGHFSDVETGQKTGQKARQRRYQWPKGRKMQSRPFEKRKRREPV